MLLSIPPKVTKCTTTSKYGRTKDILEGHHFCLSFPLKVDLLSLLAGKRVEEEEEEEDKDGLIVDSGREKGSPATTNRPTEREFSFSSSEKKPEWVDQWRTAVVLEGGSYSSTERRGKKYAKALKGKRSK